MAVDAVTDQLDAYLLAAHFGTSRHGGAGRGRGGRKAMLRRQGGAAGRGTLAQCQQGLHSAPIGVAGPHQKCFLEGLPQFPPPAAR
jgi:hypothetical protein